MSDRPLPAPASERRAVAGNELALFAGTVLVWGTTWIALKYQLGTVAPQVSLVWRFAIAAPLMALVCVALRNPLRFPAAMHLRFLTLGLFLYSTNFLLFYNAGHYLVSGLLSVVFSLASLTNIALSVLILRERLRLQVLVGAALGLAGVAFLFLHEVDPAHLGGGPLAGLALGALGCLSFSIGNMLATRLVRDGVPAMSANAWGVTYGACICALYALATGSAFVVEPTPRYLLALLWLAIPGSVLAFWMYVTLLTRIGPDRAGYTAVLAPVLALVVSTLVEDYRWSLAAIAGLALVAAGNVLVLRAKGR